LERFFSSINKTDNNFIFLRTSPQIPTLRFPFISMNSTKLDGVLQPTLGSITRLIFIHKYQLFKFPICNRHLCKLVSIPTKEKIFFVFIIHDPTMYKICRAKETKCKKHCFMFLLPKKERDISPISNLFGVNQKTNNSLWTSFF
jgi:hypothetical protein